MNWKKLFESHILARGYDYYCEGAVENLDVDEDFICADVIGSEEYEVEINLLHGKVTEMYCSCPYAEDGRNCKHMAAVLYEWSDQEKEDTSGDEESHGEAVNVFGRGHTVKAYEQKQAAIRKIVDQADMDTVREYLTGILAEDEKLLVRFTSLIGVNSEKEDMKHYIRQVNDIADRHMGRDRFINYYAAGDFISELEDIYDTDVRRMIDKGQYMGAFELINYIFVLVGDVDMDDSDGGTGMLADHAYQLWLDLLAKVTEDQKEKMFQWFTSHLDGSVINYLEEYIEQIIMEEFGENEYVQKKLVFTEEMIERSGDKGSDWSRDYHVGKWAIRHLELMEAQKSSQKEIETYCRKNWGNSSVRRYYIDRCIKKKNYDAALEALDESMIKDKEYRGLIADYSQKKKEIYLLQGNKEAYLKQLWKLVLEDHAGSLEDYRELKKQYEPVEWIEKREVVFQSLPKYVRIERFYQEEKLYDRLLTHVVNSPGLYALQEYGSVLKKDYPRQILAKYEKEVRQMAAYTGTRKKYQELVGLLRTMKKIKDGTKVVERIVDDWKQQYRNRPAMMEELQRL
ncbi:MAG: SWIM zinc finger family protein [Lachnospiraceae bacterium]|nr:SWIM zinc finger family protein [Lachnospiraceae bacterium]